MTHRTNQKKKCDWVLWFTGIAYRNSDLKYEDAPLEQCFYARFNIIISTDMDNYYYYLSLQTSPRSSREILLLLQQWGLFGEEKKGTSDFLGQVSSPSSKISIWSSKQAFSNLVLPLSFFFFLFFCRVVHMTVCLSDSQLHLFLQTQLPVGHIQDCVQGHTPYSVTDAILTYASSNQGLAQAQEDDLIKEPCLTISYESMER